MANKNKNEALVKALLNLTAPKIDNSKMANQLKGFPQGMGSKQGVYKLPADYNVKNEIKDAALLANSFAPVTGDIQSGVMADQDLAKGNYGSAALNGLGLLPFIPSMAGMIASKGNALAGAIKPLTKYELAHQTAQKNAVEMLGLPPNNTAMERAKALGFDTTAYHGTARVPNEDAISSFDYSMGRKGSGNRDGLLGTFSTDNPDVASSFADFAGKYSNPQVMPLMLKNGKEWNPEKYAEISDLIDKHTTFANKDLYGGKPLRMAQDVIDASSARNELINNGFDSVSLKNTLMDSPDRVTPINQYVSIKPENIRSRFAAFDPARAHEADLLGRATPEMLGLLAVGSGAGVGYAYNKKEKKKTK